MPTVDWSDPASIALWFSKGNVDNLDADALNFGANAVKYDGANAHHVNPTSLVVDGSDKLRIGIVPNLFIFAEKNNVFRFNDLQSNGLILPTDPAVIGGGRNVLALHTGGHGAGSGYGNAISAELEFKIQGSFRDFLSDQPAFDSYLRTGSAPGFSSAQINAWVANAGVITNQTTTEFRYSLTAARLPLSSIGGVKDLLDSGVIFLTKNDPLLAQYAARLSLTTDDLWNQLNLPREASRFVEVPAKIEAFSRLTSGAGFLAGTDLTDPSLRFGNGSYLDGLKSLVESGASNSSRGLSLSAQEKYASLALGNLGQNAALAEQLPSGLTVSRQIGGLAFKGVNFLAFVSNPVSFVVDEAIETAGARFAAGTLGLSSGAAAIAGSFVTLAAHTGVGLYAISEGDAVFANPITALLRGDQPLDPVTYAYQKIAGPSGPKRQVMIPLVPGVDGLILMDSVDSDDTIVVTAYRDIDNFTIYRLLGGGAADQIGAVLRQGSVDRAQLSGRSGLNGLYDAIKSAENLGGPTLFLLQKSDGTQLYGWYSTAQRAAEVVGAGGAATPFRTGDGNTLRLEFDDGRTVTISDKLIIEKKDGEQTKVGLTNSGQKFVTAFGDSGQAIGTIFGSYLAGNDAIVRISSSVVLGQIGSIIGTTLGGVVAGKSVSEAVKSATASLGSDTLNAGIGAVSSYLTGELVRAIGINGVAGELISTTGSIVITQIVTNIAFNATAAASEKVNVFKDVTNPALFASAVGSYFGNKLASALVKFDTIGGQLGSAVGSSVAVIGALALLTNPGGWVVLGVSALASFVGNIIGGLIGSLFGGVPRSGADVIWDSESGAFEVANLYSRKNGSKAAANSIATTVANTFNGLIASIGGTLLSPEAVKAGNYGMWKKDYVYRPLSNQSQESITYRAPKGKNAASDLINYGVGQALNGGFNIAGGSLILKRALYNSLELAGANFKVDALLGDIEIGRRYQSYLQNSTAANALIAAESDSVFAAEQAIILARAVELGLTRRAASDWFGGFSFLLEQLGALPSTTSFRFEYDPSSERISRAIDMGDYSFGDVIDVAGQTIIEGTGGSDNIRLIEIPAQNSPQIISQIAAPDSASGFNIGLKVNGAAFSGPAQNIDVAAIIDAGGGDDIVYASGRGDNIFGGLGDDTLIGGKLDDWLIGGDGNDKLFAGAVTDGTVSAAVAIAANGGNGNYLDGGAGSDALYGSTGSDWLVGGDGDGVDTLLGGAGGDILNAGAGNEGLALDGSVRIQGGAGSDQYVFNRGDGADIYFDETEGNTPGASGDSISVAAKARTAGTLAKNWAGGGDFLVDGSTKGGDDAVVFGVGITMADILLERSGAIGFEGMDLIIKIQRPDGTWQPGDDQITIKDWFEGTRRIEWLRFTNGEEIRIGDFTSFQKGTAGNDVIVGTNGNDFQYGGDGDDRLFGLAGNDWQVGGKGNDLVSGNDDNDYELGGDDNDVVLGGLGNDVVSGDAGNDTVYGGSGDDLVVGGKGDDELVGGEGSDVFRFNRGDGRDTLFDDYAGTWETAWQNGAYVTSADFTATTGYKYAVDASGTVTRTANDVTIIVADSNGWTGKYDYNEQGGVKTLKRLVPPASGPLTRNASGTDTLEFGVGIDIQDVVFRRDAGSDDLRIAVTRSGSSLDVFDETPDQIRIKDWYSATAGVGKSIENFLFVNTGIQAASTMNLIGGTDLNDTLTATGSVPAWITGGAGDDSITGWSGADILNGSSGADTISGAGGADVLYGGDGDDVLNGGAGADILIGGSGSDTAGYGTSAVTVFLDSTQGTNTGDATGDTFVSVENLTGSSGIDSLYGDTGSNVLDGASGNDTLYGNAGDDVYFLNASTGTDVIVDRLMTGISPGSYDAGDDTVEVGVGYSLSNLVFAKVGVDLEIRLGASTTHKAVLKDFYSGAAGAKIENLVLADGLLINLANTRLSGESATADADFFAGGTGNDTFDALAGNDVLSGGAGADTLRGGDGDDVLEGGVGADILDGGTDTISLGGAPSADGNGDLIRYTVSTAAVTVNLATSTASGGDAQGDTIVKDANGISTIEKVGGSAFNDVLTGDARANTLIGLAGNDTLSGGAGDDVLLGGDGVDIIAGGDGSDNIDAGDGDDVNVRGDAGNDIIAGGLGNDILFGDDGDDRLNGDAGDDTLWGSAGSDVLVGGDGNDSLNGDAGNDQLAGGSGNDTLSGGDGDDTLSGDLGDDALNGGLGNDNYAFDSNNGNDTIIDASGSNRILLSGVTEDQIWLTRAGSDLKIGVIGGTTRITVTGYFSATSPTLIREIVTAGSSIFLKYAGGQTYAGSLIEAMTLASAAVPETTAAVPAAVATLRDGLWWQGGKAAPILADRAVTTNEDVVLSGTAGAMDHDENISGYAVAVQATRGVVAINTATGAWTYTPSPNYAGEDSFSLSVTDADNQTTQAVFSVTVIPTNDAPRFGITPVLAVDENEANGFEIANLVATDTEGNPFSFSINGVNSPFAISTSGLLTVRDSSLLNFEDAATSVVSVRVSDGTDWTDQNFTVTVRNVNERPNAPELQAGAIARVSEPGAAGSPAISGTTIATFTLTDRDIIGPENTVPTLRVKAGSLPTFATSGNLLVFSADYLPNFDTLAPTATLVDRDADGLKEIEYSVEVEAVDAGNMTSLTSVTVTVGIEDVNEAPTAINFTSPTIDERDRPITSTASPAVSLGLLTVVDPDLAIAGESHVWSVTDTRFEIINGNELRLKAGQALDYEAALVEAGTNKRYVDVSVTVNDRAGVAGGNTLTQAKRVYISDDKDYYYGTTGNDTIAGGANVDLMYGGNGNDTLSGLAGADELFGELGNDTLSGGDGNDLLFGGVGDDIMNGDAGDDTLWGDDGADTLSGGDGGDTVRGGANDDRIIETLAVLSNDSLYGDDGNDIIRAGGGDDTVEGGLGNDVIYGGTGNDTVRGDSGDDVISPGDGIDNVDGGAGIDRLDLYWQDENVAMTAGVTVDLTTPSRNTGAAASDTYTNIENISGTAFADDLTGNAGDNEISGDAGNDILSGGDGADRLLGGTGNDSLFGGNGDDQLLSEAGNDTLAGGSGNDVLTGGLGDDVLIGGVGDDRFTFARGDGNDIVDQTGSLPSDKDLVGFTNINRDNLWFSWVGNDVKIGVLGAAGLESSVTLKDFKTVSVDQRAQIRVVIAQTDATVDLKLGELTDRLAGFASALGYTPTTQAQFDALRANTTLKVAGLTFQQTWDNYWAGNSAAVFTPNADDVMTLAAISEDQYAGTVQRPAFGLSFTLSDDFDAPTQLTERTVIAVAAAGSTTPNSSLLNLGVTWPTINGGTGTITVATQPNASGTGYIWVHTKDTGGQVSDQWLSVNVAAVANAPTVVATSNGGNAGSLIPVSISPTLVDTDGSESILRVEVRGLPADMSFVNAAAGVTSGANLSAGVWSFTAAQLAELAISVPVGRTLDLAGANALQVTAISREASNGATATSASVPLTVRINAPPTTVALRSSGVDENVAPGTIVGVLVANDPDRLEANLITDLNLAAGESRSIVTTGPEGTTVTAVQTGQVDTDFGGGTFATNNFTIDPSKAYKFTTFVRADVSSSALLLFGLSPDWARDGQSVVGYVDRASDGAGITNPYFLVAEQSSLTVGKWYRVEGYVLPQGSANLPQGVFGGVFDIATGAKILDTETFRWNETWPNNQVSARFSTYHGAPQPNSTSWYETVVEQLPSFSLTNAPGLSVDSATGLVRASLSPDFETTPSLALTAVATDGGGLSSAPTALAVSVRNVNEVATIDAVSVTATLTETGLAGVRPANANATIATIVTGDLDGTTPTLEFSRGNPGNWFVIDQASKQLRLSAAANNFNYEDFKALGYEIGDWNGNGIFEVKIADVYVRSTDGALPSAEKKITFTIEDVAETPNAPGIISQTNIFGETVGGGPSAQAGRTVAMFALSDPDGSAPVLEIAAGDPSGWFTIFNNELRFAGHNFTADWVRANIGIYGTTGQSSYDTDGDGLKEAHIGEIRVVARDSTNKVSAETIVNVFIEDVVESPNAPVILSQTNVFSETVGGGPSAQAGRTVATFGLSDPDGPAPDLQIAGGDPYGWFTIVGNQLRFASPNFSADWIRANIGVYGTTGQSSYDTDGDGLKEAHIGEIRVVARDSTNKPSAETVINVFIEDANETPTITTTSLPVREDILGAGQGLVGKLLWTDPDSSTALRSPTFAITSGAPAGLFSFAGNELRLQGVLDYETTPTYNLTVRITDAGGLTSTKNITVNVANVNEAPIPTLNYKTQGVYNGLEYVEYFINANDPDSAGPFTVTATKLSGLANASILWDAASERNYLRINDFNSRDGYDNGTIRVTVTDSDGQPGVLNVDYQFAAYTPPGPGPGEQWPPVIIDLDGDGIELVSLVTSTVRFDMDGDGLKDRTGWVGADDGFLVLDRNYNGIIDNANEFSFKADLEGAVSDLDGLRAFDSNNDGVFGAADRRFGEFRIWQDKNQDGVSQESELSTLADRGIKSIRLQLDETGAVPDGATDNVLYATSEFTRANGTTGDVGDVFLAYESAVDTDSKGKLKKDKKVTFAGIDPKVPLPAKLKKKDSVAASALGGATVVDATPALSGSSGLQTASPAQQQAALLQADALSAEQSPLANNGASRPVSSNDATSNASAPLSNAQGAGSSTPTPANPSSSPTAEATPPVITVAQSQTAPVADTVSAAARLLSQPAPVSLNVVQLPGSLQFGSSATPIGFSSGETNALADTRVDRLIAAMAAFQGGEGIGTLANTALAVPEARLTQLAPAI